MSEKDKGFNFKQLFFRETATGAPEKQDQKVEPVSNKSQDYYVSNTNPQTTSGVVNQSLVEDFVQRLQNLINQNNQSGFDFLEFTESLFEEKQNPGPEVYKTVFRIAQKIDKSLTPARLLDSAMFYKDLVQRTAETEINKGVSKKQGLQEEKDNERTTLDTGLKDTRSKIQQLTKQIQELQNQEVSMNNQLLAIDQKYEGKFSDIESKINAIRSAKEQVIVSIVDIEAGIKSNLS
jgi:flagellar biosynthesis chaperone FliJ